MARRGLSYEERAANLPQPPYTYDDPRITYDEPCFYYNGGWDLICKLGVVTYPRIKGGKGSSSTSDDDDDDSYKRKLLPETYEYIFKTEVVNLLDQVFNNNEEEAIIYEEIKKFSVPKESLSIAKINVNAHYTTMTKIHEHGNKNINAQITMVKKNKKLLSPPKKLKKVEIIENKELKYNISSSLQLNKPKMIIFKKKY